MTEQSDAGLSLSEAAALVAELKDYQGLSFREISECVPKTRAWVENRYDEHGGYDLE